MHSSIAHLFVEQLHTRTDPGAVIGKIARIDEKGKVFVHFPGNAQGPVAAKVCGSVRTVLEKGDLAPDGQVLLVFEQGDSARPVVIDIVDGGRKRAG